MATFRIIFYTVSQKLYSFKDELMSVPVNMLGTFFLQVATYMENTPEFIKKILNYNIQLDNQMFIHEARNLRSQFDLDILLATPRNIVVAKIHPALVDIMSGHTLNIIADGNLEL